MMVGLGIRLLKETNLALPGKRLWKIENVSQGLWKQVLFSKYEIPKDSLLVHDPSCSSSLWKRIDPCCQRDVYEAGEISSWQRWQNFLLPLATSFPEVCNCTSNQQDKVIDYLERRGDSVLWGPTFRRHLNEVEEGQFRSLLICTANVFIPINGKIEGYEWL